MPDHWKEGSLSAIPTEYLDITQHEIDALKVDYNLADAHTHQSQSSTQKEIVARLPELWYESERNKQYDMEQRFIEAFFRVQRRPRALEPNNALLVYAASIAMVITANYLRKMNMSVSLIEPCFDNIHDILAHMGVPMQPLREESLEDEEAIYRNLKEKITSDAIFVVDPNNPTGFTLLGGRRKAFDTLVRFAKDTNRLLILDFCFAAFISREAAAMRSIPMRFWKRVVSVIS
jgi:Aspartate/tyrosine/aromatic aminotransferase